MSRNKIYRGVYEKESQYNFHDDTVDTNLVPSCGDKVTLLGNWDLSLYEHAQEDTYLLKHRY